MPPNESTAKAFIDEVIALGKEYGLSISHEDTHGGFIIEIYSDHNADWLKDAEIDLPE